MRPRKGPRCDQSVRGPPVIFEHSLSCSLMVVSEDADARRTAMLHIARRADWTSWVAVHPGYGRRWLRRPTGKSVVRSTFLPAWREKRWPGLEAGTSVFLNEKSSAALDPVAGWIAVENRGHVGPGFSSVSAQPYPRRKTQCGNRCCRRPAAVMLA